jgi:D-alanyl-D-alanine-carboxypeptidase/D-alanyl-D-alanine-endopeptidase
MKITVIARLICFYLVFLTVSPPAAAREGFSNADVDSIKAFLHENFDHTNSGMVIGLVDGQGSRIFSAGKLDNGTGQEVNGDTVFEIGSITKTFTTLLLMDMVERGEMKLEDPVSKYLPKSVRMPAWQGQEITLLNLAAQDSGLPFNADNILDTDDGDNPFANYTVEKMYDFLSRHALTNEPGKKFQYSNIGMGLLGHVIALKAGTNYESLVLDRICRPLHMDSTRVVLGPELQSRLARGHVPTGKPAPNWDIHAIVGAGGLRSTVNDLFKYVSANLGLIPSKLTPSMEKMQVLRHTDSSDFGKTRMPWYDLSAYSPAGMELFGHGGGTGGYGTYIGFDKKQRRGIVVLSNQRGIHSTSVALRILQHARLKGIKPTEIQPIREMVGTGIAFNVDKETHLIRISKVYPDSYAARAGLSVDQIIQKIEGVSTLNKSLAEGLTLFRANGAPTVRLEVVDPKRTTTNTVELARGKFLTDQ